MSLRVAAGLRATRVADRPDERTVKPAAGPWVNADVAWESPGSWMKSSGCHGPTPLGFEGMRARSTPLLVRHYQNTNLAGLQMKSLHSFHFMDWYNTAGEALVKTSP